ncbi:hypothetical protein PAMP_014862 [Pampus punctatissimus]
MIVEGIGYTSPINRKSSSSSSSQYVQQAVPTPRHEGVVVVTTVHKKGVCCGHMQRVNSKYGQINQQALDKDTHKETLGPNKQHVQSFSPTNNSHRQSLTVKVGGGQVFHIRKKHGCFVIHLLMLMKK